MTWFQRLLLITIFATFVLVIIGGTVRATDSGLGCPDWPRCHGQLIPPAEKHTLIEFSHRTAATVVGFLFLGVTALTFGTQRKNPLIFWTLFAAGVVLAFQIILGGITVKKELPNGIVALHLGTAMTFMALMISAATVSIMRRRGQAVADGAGQSSFTRMALLTAAAAFATLVLGSYIADSDAALACSGWPLCNGSLVPGGDSAVGLHFLHRLLAGLLGLLLLALIYLGCEERRGKLLLSLTGFAGAAFVAQALIGAANIWTELAAGVVVAHLSLAALLWCLMVSISALSYYLPGREAAPERPASEQASSKVREWVR